MAEWIAVKCEMPSRNPPQLVVSNTDADLKRQQAEKERSFAQDEVSWNLRQMTANLIRVVRGAGSPYQIVDHAREFLEAVAKYQDACGDLAVMNLFPNMLSTENERLVGANLTQAEMERRSALDEIVRGSLQITASRLVGQNTQERAGDSELRSGTRRLERALADLRQELERQQRKARTARPAGPKQ